ncbi:kinase-like domain-containing protein, partial [Baffinella frigidus]
FNMSPDECRYIMVIDLADGGALFDLIIEAGNLTEAQASDHVLQVVQGLLHMHRMRVSHCDIKPENMLISSEGNCKSVMLCDLGTCHTVDYQVPKTPCIRGLLYSVGTGYLAPEIVRKQECTEAVDMWALGVVTYIMLCGSNPFDPYGTATDSELLHNVVISKIDTENEMWQHLSSPCKDLIRGLLTIEPTARLTAEQVLQHPWMVNQNTTAV